jgi:sigma-E factor negative regulatory protein RseA
MTDHKERLEESLSALMDGETTDMEMHRLLKEIASDTSLRDKWKRYHMISATIKGETVSPSMDYSASIVAAIDAEPAYRSKGFTLFAGAAGRFAIAASVAMLAVVGVQQLNSPLDSSPVVSEFAAMDEDDQNNGPAIQFPSGFQPIINARTVSVGGDNKKFSFPQASSQLSMLAQSVLVVTIKYLAMSPLSCRFASRKNSNTQR